MVGKLLTRGGGGKLLTRGGGGKLLTRKVGVSYLPGRWGKLLTQFWSDIFNNQLNRLITSESVNIRVVGNGYGSLFQ